MEVIWALGNLTWKSVLDILLVALVFFGASFFFRGTQTRAVLRGMLLVLACLLLASGILDLLALRWLLSNILVVLGLAIPIIFQPELRRALEQLGRARLFRGQAQPIDTKGQIIDEVCQAVEKLSERRHGALIVLQRGGDLQEYVRTGISLNSLVSSHLLLTIFWPKTELHDGAAIINHEGMLASAASVLPLTASRNLPDPKLGTRHRAALGISEVSDAICIVVSEETGRIAITNAGRLIPKLDPKRLRTILDALYGGQDRQRTTTLRAWRQNLVDAIRERQKQA